MENIIGLLVSYLFIFLVIFVAKFFEKLGKEASRKFIHIMLSNWWFIAMWFFKDPIWAAIGPISFVIINWLSYKKDIISVMERTEDKKDGLGTVYYALSLLILVILTFGIFKRTELGLASILIMGYGDGFAAVFGKAIKSKEYKVGGTTKTLVGSATMFLVTYVIVGILFAYLGVTAWCLKAILIGAILTVVEAVSIKGTDNITVPIMSFLLLILMA